VEIKQSKTEPTPWIGVDLDGTLAHYDAWSSIEHIGKPVPAMLKRVQQWLQQGKKIKIMTARASDPKQMPLIKEWLKEYDLQNLEITNQKDFQMVELWDDRAIQVMPNQGISLAEHQKQNSTIHKIIRTIKQPYQQFIQQKRVKYLRNQGHEVSITAKEIIIDQTFNYQNLCQDLKNCQWLKIHCAKCEQNIEPIDLKEKYIDSLGRIHCQKCNGKNP